MEFLQLRIFDSLAHTLSLTKTAEMFNITQPAVSHNLKRLEESYGVKLFVRTSRGITLTDAGKEFLTQARAILETIETADIRMRNFANGQNGVMRIATIPSAIYLLFPCIKHFHEIEPNIQVDIDIFEGPELLNQILLRNYDFFLSTSGPIGAFVGYDHVDIADESVDLFVGKSNLDEIDPDDLSGALLHFPLVSLPMINSNLSEPIINILAKHKVKPGMVYYYNRAESVLLAVSAGIGIALLPRGLTQVYPCNDIAIIPIEGGENCRKYVFSMKKESSYSPASQLFIQTVVDYFNAGDRITYDSAQIENGHDDGNSKRRKSTKE